jgi:hypothetical protein
MTAEVTVVDHHRKCGGKWAVDYIRNLPTIAMGTSG